MEKQIIIYKCGHIGEVELDDDDIREKISYLGRNQVCPECFFRYKGYTECPVPKGENLPSEHFGEVQITTNEIDNSQEVDYDGEEFLNWFQMVEEYNQRPAVDSSYDFEAQIALEQSVNIPMMYDDINMHGYSVLHNKGTKMLYLPLWKPWTCFNRDIVFEERYCRYVIIDSKRYFVESDIFSIIGRDELLSRIALNGVLLSSKDIIELHDPLIRANYPTEASRSVIKVCSEKWLEYCVLRRIIINMLHRKASIWTEALSYLYETILNKNISDCDIAEFESVFKQARSCPRKIYDSERAMKGHKNQLESKIKKKHSIIEEQKRLLTFEEPLRKLVEELIIKSGVIQKIDTTQFPSSQTNFEVKKFILEFENKELKDLFHKCMHISIDSRDGNRKNFYQANLFYNALRINEFHWEFEIPEPKLPYIRCASNGIDLQFNCIRNKLSQLIDKLNSLEAELISLTS